MIEAISFLSHFFSALSHPPNLRSITLELRARHLPLKATYVAPTQDFRKSPATCLITAAI